MSDNIKKNRNQISKLGKFMISQLKSSPWHETNEGFYNKHFIFSKIYGSWQFEVAYSSNRSSNRYSVSDFISPIYFWYLRIFFVNPAIRNQSKIKKESEMAKMSENFFDSNKDIERDSKLEEILN